MLATTSAKVTCPACRGTGEGRHIRERYRVFALRTRYSFREYTTRCLACKGTGEVEADRVCPICHHFVDCCICPHLSEGKEWKGLRMVRVRRYDGNGHRPEEGSEVATRETVADPDADVIAKLRVALRRQRDLMEVRGDRRKRIYRLRKMFADQAWDAYEAALDAICEWEDD